VRRYLDDPELCSLHGRNGARYVRERFDRRRITEQLWQGLQSITGSSEEPDGRP
jgi:glycosyltransferase involved in cell wall biosynthesis